MSNTATTIEQSKRLLELGLDRKSADMFYPIDGSSFPEVCDNGDNMQADNPAWSLSALLEVMPKPDLYREAADLWVCATFFKEGSIRGYGETSIDATCDTITKMFERGYLKKKGG